MRRPAGWILLGCALIVSAGSACRPTDAAPDARASRPPQYASLATARDSVGAIVVRSMRHAGPTIPIRREAVRFEYIYAKARASGWAFHVTVTDTTGCPFEAVQRGLTAAGWAEHFGYSADGPDGSSMGFVCRNYFCLVEGRWDGGDNSDSTYVPLPGCKVIVTCVPRREDDFPPP